MNNINSSLQMLSFFFTKMSVELNNPLTESPNLKNTVSINHARKKDDNYQVKVQIDYTLESEDSSFKLYLQALGFFKLEKSEDMPETIANDILNKNTIAIMFPFIRSQVSLMTTQPGMSPILVQPIDVNKLFEGKTSENSDDTSN